MDAYFQRPQVKTVALLYDIRRDYSFDEINYLSQIPHIKHIWLVLTKADKLKKAQQKEKVKQAEAAFAKAYKGSLTVVAASVLNQDSIHELRDHIFKTLETL